MIYDCKFMIYGLSQACEPKIAQSYYFFCKRARKNAKIFDIFAFLAVLAELRGVNGRKSGDLVAEDGARAGIGVDLWLGSMARGGF